MLYKLNFLKYAFIYILMKFVLIQNCQQSWKIAAPSNKIPEYIRRRPLLVTDLNIAVLHHFDDGSLRGHDA